VAAQRGTQNSGVKLGHLTSFLCRHCFFGCFTCPSAYVIFVTFLTIFRTAILIKI
jgi:hypothetical protein